MLYEVNFQFNVKNISVHSGKLEPIRLYEYNRLELERLIKIESEEDKLIRNLQTLINERFVNEKNVRLRALDEDYLRIILRWSVNRITNLKDLLDKNFNFLWLMPVIDEIPTKEQVNYVRQVMKMLKEDNSLNRTNFNDQLKTLCKEERINFSDLMKLLRKILSGLKVNI